MSLRRETLLEHFRLWHLVDMGARSGEVRFRRSSRPIAISLRRLILTHSGLVACLRVVGDDTLIVERFFNPTWTFSDEIHQPGK